MRLKLVFLGFICLAGGGTLCAQDLGQLTQRVTGLWEARIRSSKSAAVKFVDPQTQDAFLDQIDTPVLGFKLSGIEFTDDPKQVYVTVKVRGVVAQLGELERVVRDSWIWKDGQWLMHATPPPSMFETDIASRPAAPVRPDFQIAQTSIDVGRHVQGDVVEGKIPFKAKRGDIIVIRPGGKIPGLAIETPVWTDASGGYLPYRWETALLSENVNQSIPLEAIGTGDGHTWVDLTFRASIDGKVGFRQNPEIIDPTRDGQLELQIQNLTGKPLKILSVMSYNPFYTIDENIAETIEPGKTGRLLIRYRAHTRAGGASIGLVLSEPLTSSGIVTVPINVNLADVPRPAEYTPDTLKPFVPPTPPEFKGR